MWRLLQAVFFFFFFLETMTNPAFPGGFDVHPGCVHESALTTNKLQLPWLPEFPALHPEGVIWFLWCPLNRCCCCWGRCQPPEVWQCHLSPVFICWLCSPAAVTHPKPGELSPCDDHTPELHAGIALQLGKNCKTGEIIALCARNPADFKGRLRLKGQGLLMQQQSHRLNNSRSSCD